MNIIGYARVSTLEQNPELQQHALLQAGAIRIFTDYESGSPMQRPQLTECLNYLRENDGDVLVVWKLDRLGGSVCHVIDTVDNLGERGVAFRSLTEGFDTTTAGGEFLFRIMAALAHMERGMIVERTYAGRGQGRPSVGRPTVMTAERTETARTLREQGRSLDHIASVLGVGRSSVSRALSTLEH
ncbi:recombinase family protein [Rhodococcus erythropolis]|uniref:recombinase family protein n=1 Tax=Rhodococcus erythropolis TaxID=1833 RepID=UPI0029493E31|nr:recombinase family protein [Rhodococcus erythropolis]MDV6278622.1 recombinase family protein [Rhodococcus erythropolis]